ncbi:MAG: acyl carrier protein [Clostridia bacterium]|nr:acyl carrier protein [Clostridia bacterium]
MKEKILQICKNIDDTIDYSVDGLVDNGLLDSVTLIEIVSGLEDTLKISIPYEEISPENFNSIDAMIKMVTRYV